MNKKKILFGVIALLIILSFAYFIKMVNLKEINKSQINVEQFIKCTDKASFNKAQVNWKNVVSIMGVLNNNKFKNISNDQIEEIANLFLVKENNVYKILSLDDVTKILKFNKSKINRVNNYINDLNSFGLTPSRLEPNGKYIKFIDSIKESAITNYKNYNILPSITIAQAILESNWGESELSAKYNNLFGIKSHTYWKGDSVNIETSEYHNQIIKDNFRVYKTKSDSIKDHAKFLSENSRYKDVFNKNTYIEQAKELQDSGYSTVSDENGGLTYSKLIDQLIQQYNLQLIDSQVQQIKG